MVKPGGTGRPRLAISARLGPLPPSRSRISALPSALPSPNVNTHLPALAATGAALVEAALLGTDFAATFGATGFFGAFATALETALAAGFTAGLAAALATGFGARLASALRAAGAAFALAEDFDFAGIFAGVFEAALAIACTQPARGMGNCAPYTTLGRSAQVEEFRRMKAWRWSHSNNPSPIAPFMMRKIATIRFSSRGMIRM